MTAYIVLRVVSKDGSREYRKAWPFTHPPGVGQHVAVPYFGYAGPQRVEIRQLAWSPTGEHLDIELHQQNSLAGDPPAGELDSFYLDRGWFCGGTAA